MFLYLLMEQDCEYHYQCKEEKIYNGEGFIDYVRAFDACWKHC